MAIDTPNPNAVPAANGLLLRLKCDSIKVADVVIKRFDTNAKVAHFLMFSINISSGFTQKYSKNRANAKKHRNKGSSPKIPQNPNRERKPIQPYQFSSCYSFLCGVFRTLRYKYTTLFSICQSQIMCSILVDEQNCTDIL